MQLQELMGKTCVIGLSYFGLEGEVLKQTQCCGTVIKVDKEMGISVQLQHSDPDIAKAAVNKAPAEQPVFILPPHIEAWFRASPGHYRHVDTGVDMLNPDFLVTWNIFRTQQNTVEGKHEWWEWVPNTTPPQVGNNSGIKAHNG